MFKRASKLYDFDPNGLDLHNGMSVITETARGVELGECVSGIIGVPDDRVQLPLKPIIRIATEQDLATQRRNEQSEKEAFDIAVEKIAEHNLEMKLVDVEYAFDHSKIIFYFTANGRVDFRMLVKNLAGIFKTRIELRQIGVRDEAKMLGGIGPCGRPICCRTYLGDFTPVSIKMAKEQNLSLNPTKISGLCDRLMCCLKYEQDHYETTRKRMPRVGREIITPDGVGTINAINVLSETVRVRIAVGDAFELREYPIDDCQRPRAARMRPRRSARPSPSARRSRRERKPSARKSLSARKSPSARRSLSARRSPSARRRPSAAISRARRRANVLRRGTSRSARKRVIGPSAVISRSAAKSRAGSMPPSRRAREKASKRAKTARKTSPNARANRL